MKKYIEPQKEIPVSYETDVLVIGAGPAGFAAAYSAAKNGASVIIVEQYGDIGGTSTCGLMSHWVGNVNCSVYSEILRRSAMMNEGEHKDKITIYIDPEKLKLLYLNMLDEVNCKILLYTSACDVIIENNIVKGVITENKNGREAITHYKVIERFGNYTHIQCKLETGRTHQIRVHMSSIGHPLVGDSVYGPAKCPFPHLQGQTLHAKTLGFTHPSTNEYLEVNAPLPDYFVSLINRLKNN